MATVIVKAKVKDFYAWKTNYQTGKGVRESFGITELASGKTEDDLNTAYAIWDVKDPSVLQSMYANENVRKGMEASGVIGLPEMIIIQ